MPLDETGLSELSDVGLTGITCALSHAIESRSPRPLLHDPHAEAIAAKLQPLLARSPNALLRRMAGGEAEPVALAQLALRARKYDEVTRRFWARHPGACVVNLGAGLDTRFWRTDDGAGYLFDLDLPPTMALKRRLVSETDRYRMIGQSALELSWIDQVVAEHPGPYLILAEGLFMYLPPEGVRTLVLALQRRMPGCELVFEAANKRWLQFPLSWLVAARMRSYGLGGARFVFGLGSGREIEGWGAGIRVLEEWFSADVEEPRLGFFREYRRFDVVRRAQWTVSVVLEPLA